MLRGNVPRPTFTAELRRSAPPRWDGEAAFSLLVAEQHAKRGEATGVAGLLARAVLATAHARLATRGSWALNEKGIIARANLEEAGEILTAVGWTPKRLEESISHMRDVLKLERPADLQFDAVVRHRDTTVA